MEHAVSPPISIVSVEVFQHSFFPSAPTGSPLIKNLTVAILELSESGFLIHLWQKWWASSCLGGNNTHSSEALQPGDLRALFLLLGLGLGVGLLLALLELMSKARSKAKDGKVGEQNLLLKDIRK